MTIGVLVVSSPILKAAEVTNRKIDISGNVMRSSFRRPDTVSMILTAGNANTKLMKPNPMVNIMGYFPVSPAPAIMSVEYCSNQLS